MQEIKRLGVLSVAKISLLFGILVGLVAGIALTILGAYAPSEIVGSLPAMYAGGLALVALPVMYGIIYFLAGLIGTALFNLFARWVGGVKVDFKK